MAQLKKGERVGDWTLKRRLQGGGPVGRKGVEVWEVLHRNGARGALKYCARTGSRDYARKRFVRELDLMTRLRGTPGVLPILDVDPQAGKEWFVTEWAKLLKYHFGGTSDFRSVVTAFAHLATVLADLHETRGITHRDIKPDNLFWLRGEALLGDFGIAHDAAAQAGLTGAGKVGPWGFIAPEALNNDENGDWPPADVYSLAKCLWKFASKVRLPPQGTLYVFEPSNDLYLVGGRPAIELGRLLEQCTAIRTSDRPRMRDFRDELTCWLNSHPAGTVQPPEPDRVTMEDGTTFAAIFFNPGDALRKASRSVEAITENCVRSIMNPLRDCLDGSSALDQAPSADLDPGQQVNDHITGGDPDWAYEFSATLSLQWENYQNTRVIVEGIGTHDVATYFGQWQTRIDSGEDWRPATPMRHTSGRMWFPTDFAERAQLCRQLRADALTLPRTT